MSKKFILKESTRKRCKIVPITDELIAQFRPISLDHFSYLWEVPSIEFSIFIRIENEIIEYIKPSELSHELLQHIWSVSLRDDAGVDVFIHKKDFPKFEHTLVYVRQRKINTLVEKDPTLDRKTLEVFADLSGASQMILRGGITKAVAERVKSAAAHMVSQLMDNDFAMGTLSRMIIIDPTLYDHSASVAMFATIMARQYINPDLPFREAEIITQCGLYHDAGKSCIPNAILNKPGSFTPEEFEVMKTHALHGYKELMHAIQSGAPIDELAARVALEHHERFTGKGYPMGKRGRLEEDPIHGIHVYTRMVSIADAYSALLMKRVYKPALPVEMALEILERSAPDDFDNAIMDPFIHGVRRSLTRKHEQQKEKEKEKEKDFDKDSKDGKEKRQGHIYMLDEHDKLVHKINETRLADQKEADHKGNPSKPKIGA